jgi:cytochrome P450
VQHGELIRELNRSPFRALAELRAQGDLVQGELMSLLGVDLPMSTGLDAVAGVPFTALGFEAARAVLLDGTSFSSGAYALTIGRFLGRTILEMDGTEHIAHRRLLSAVFSKREMAMWTRKFIVPTINNLIDSIAGVSTTDLVKALTYALPIRVIGQMLGLPKDDVDWFQSTASVMVALEVEDGGDMGTREGAAASLGSYFHNLIDLRRSEPNSDIISLLLKQEIDGHSLDADSIVSFLRLLLPAGAETIYRGSGSMLAALLTHPKQLEAIRADRGLVPVVVEETLRWEPPIMAIGRTAIRDTEVAGVTIAEGTPVHVSLGAANHDRQVFERPEQFDIGRPSHPHLTFAAGPHTCLGLQLARTEMAALCNAVLDRLPDLALENDSAIPAIEGIAFRSPPRLPVRIGSVRAQSK